MCQLLSTLPKRSHTIGNNSSKKNLFLSLKKCPDDKTYYRFRLLNFSSDGKNDRDDPWITRFVHRIWGKNDKGNPVLEDQIVCPVTPYVKIEGNRYDACPICTYANKNFISFKESNWKDKEANKKARTFGRVLECIIPVYVVNDINPDPQYNVSGKFKVLIFNDKKFYQEFREKVEKALRVNPVFNGKGAVDCCIHVSEVTHVAHEGEPNEYTWKTKEIDKVIFSNKPYDIPSINKDTCSAMGFDDEFYVSSTQDEINAFYKKYCVVSDDDIPDDDIPVYDSDINNEVPKKVVNVQNTNIATDDISQDEVNDLVNNTSSTIESNLSDPDEEGLNTDPSSSNNKDVNTNDLLAELGL